MSKAFYYGYASIFVECLRIFIMGRYAIVGKGSQGQTRNFTIQLYNGSK